MAKIIEVTFEVVQPDAAREYYRVRCRSGITGEDAKRHAFQNANMEFPSYRIILAIAPFLSQRLPLARAAISRSPALPGTERHSSAGHNPRERVAMDSETARGFLVMVIAALQRESYQPFAQRRHRLDQR